MLGDFGEKQKELYKLFKPIYCPAMQELVYFPKSGLRHLLYKGQRPRSKSERNFRLSLLPYVQEVLLKAEIAVNRESGDESSTWSLQCGKIRVVVIRRKPGDRLCFLSVMTNK